MFTTLKEQVGKYKCKCNSLIFRVKAHKVYKESKIDLETAGLQIVKVASVGRNVSPGLMLR